MIAETERLHEVLTRAREEVARVIVGQADAVDQALAVILTGHHALIEGMPGVAKTLLVRSLAAVLGCEFARIQFTPDLMPSDITGTNVFNLKTSEFVFHPGPVFTAFLLADEINRAPAKTQSALLQAMQERAVTIDRQTRPLPPQFTVFATQNPIEFEGTYPLPEAQLDRFMLKIRMDPPAADEELALARRLLGDEAPEAVLAAGGIRPVVGREDLVRLQRALMAVTVRDEILGYAVEIVRRTRAHDAILVGASPRGLAALLHAARAQAAIAGRDFVTPDDVRRIAVAVLGHRLVLRPEYEIEGEEIGAVVARVLAEVPVPR
ncbi:MAG TPA: MoxR family ATPase [Candidatus Polarisedimenticolia bacterium]|nr:MoxR family ATPase [Candidatus Polarisedimenticolia bacterium]